MLTEERVFCQPSWVVQSSTVRMPVTQLGAQMGPVHFYCDQPDVLQPYHVSPWQCEEHPILAGQSESVLRGDFFCLPFGRGDAEAGVPPHGRTASQRWYFGAFESKSGICELRLHMENALCGADVQRQFFLRDGENVIYDRTTITNLAGAFTLGHHAVLRLPQKQSSLLISMSKQVFGMTYPSSFDPAAERTHQALAIAAPFTDLAAVLSKYGDFTVDCSAYPSHGGFTDLLQVGVESENGQPAWTAAVNTEEGYLWFSLRDVALLPSTILWSENKGRCNPPWNGRNVSLGLEDVCSYFDTGSEVSRTTNAFSERGIKTFLDFRYDTPLSVAYIQGVVRIPSGFGRVKSVQCGARSVEFIDSVGRNVSANVSPGFVFGEAL